MAHAYTPGLRVTRQATLRRERRLPLKGDVVAQMGEQVRRDQVVARTELPGDVVTLNLVNRLGVAPGELPRLMVRAEGEPVVAGQLLAETRPLLKWFRTRVMSPADGVLESVSSVTGQVIIRKPPRPVQVLAYVDGTVVQVIESEGVVVETTGAFVQGIFGVGGECWGPLRMLVDAPDATVDPAVVDGSCAGQVLVGGALLTYELIDQARRSGAVGIVGGGVRDRDLGQLLGYDLGVAITGSEQLGITVIVTEGFGAIAMARKTYEILADCAGREASISGATQIRAGVQRPEIIVPAAAASQPQDGGASRAAGLQRGDQVRVIRVPHFGRIGRVVDLPADLRAVESEARVRVLEIEFEGGSRTVVPRANVEVIEE